MIGGKDIYLSTRAGISALDCALRITRLFWPDVVFENGATAEIIAGYKYVEFSKIHEILAYKNIETLRQWETLGADPSLQGTMIHFISSPKELTLVIDYHPDSQIKDIIKTIRDALRTNPLAQYKSSEAA